MHSEIIEKIKNYLLSGAFSVEIQECYSKTLRFSTVLHFNELISWQKIKHRNGVGPEGYIPLLNFYIFSLSFFPLRFLTILLFLVRKCFGFSLTYGDDPSEDDEDDEEEARQMLKYGTQIMHNQLHRPDDQEHDNER